MNNIDIAKIKNNLSIVYKLASYNLRIIFGNKFIWFLIASFVLFILLSVLRVLDREVISDTTIYDLLMFPGILLIFYPTVFGIQNDVDSGIIEILFGIPDYRFKVWLIRIFMVFVLIFFILYVYSWVASILLVPFNKFELTYQLMYPIIFIGSLSFMFSTIIKNGNGTAVVMVLIGIFFLILGDSLEGSQWNIFLNPIDIPDNFNETVWAGIVNRNRIFLSVGIIISLLYGLINLQKREKFI